jgi:DNA-binding LytR/AlgR family response regulator
MNPTALIAEDEPLLATHLHNELGQHWPGLQRLGIAPTGEAAVQQALQLRPDVIFLDIHMPGKTGLEVAHELAEEWPDDEPFPLLVFVTAHDQYALQAFSHAAFDYLLKPVEPARLAHTCKRLQGVLAQRQRSDSPQLLQHTVQQLHQLLSSTGAPPAKRLSVIQAGVGQAIHIVPIDDVIYFEAADKYVRVITPSREHLIRTSLRELLPQLDPQRFWQIHRSVVVRTEAIATAERDASGKLSLTLHGHTDRLNVSRLYTHLFKAM